MITKEDKERLNNWAMACGFDSIEDMCYWSGDDLQKSSVRDLIGLSPNIYATQNRRAYQSVLSVNRKTDMKYIKLVGSPRLIEILKDKGFEAKVENELIKVTVNKQHETNTTI